MVPPQAIHRQLPLGPHLGIISPEKSASLPLLLIISGPTHCLSIVPVGFIKAPSSLCPRIAVLAATFKIPWVAGLFHDPLLSRDCRYLGLFYSPTPRPQRYGCTEKRVTLNFQPSSWTPLSALFLPAPVLLEWSPRSGEAQHRALALVSPLTSQTPFQSYSRYMNLPSTSRA